jgi:hypothetical protein
MYSISYNNTLSLITKEQHKKMLTYQWGQAITYQWGQTPLVSYGGIFVKNG